MKDNLSFSSLGAIRGESSLDGEQSFDGEQWGIRTLKTRKTVAEFKCCQFVVRWRISRGLFYGKWKIFMQLNGLWDWSRLSWIFLWHDMWGLANLEALLFHSLTSLKHLIVNLFLDCSHWKFCKWRVMLMVLT